MNVAPSLTPILLMAAGLVVMVGVLLRWGFRFRRETIPPTCRRCGYDVSQRPVGVERCSECGADLTAGGAILTTRPRGNPLIAIPTSFAVFVLFVLLVFSAGRFPWSTWFYANAPIGWIERLARSHRGRDGEVYRESWFVRGQDMPALYDHLLDLQGDASVPWTGPWGAQLFEAAQRGKLSPAQNERFERQLFPGPMRVKARSPLRVGDKLVLEVTVPSRVDSSNSNNMCARFAARMDGKAVINENRYWSLGIDGPTYTRSIAPKDWSGGVDPSPGRHKVNVVFSRELSDGDRAITRRVEFTQDVEVEVIPRGTPMGQALADPSMSDEIARAVGIYVYHWHDDRCFAEVRLFPASVNRAFTIYALIDGVETRLGTVCAGVGFGSTSDAIYVPVSVERAKKLEKLTFMLVGDGNALANTLSQTEYWPGRIVYQDVSLRTWRQYMSDSGTRLPTTWPYRIETAATRP